MHPLPCQTALNFLHVYQVHATRDPLVHGATFAAKDVCKADVYLRHSTALDLQPALCLSGSSKAILIGCADGCVASCSWSGKVRDIILPLPLDDPNQLPLLPDSPPIRSLQLCEQSSTLVLLFGNGSCALLTVPGNAIVQLRELAFSHWVCQAEQQATCVAIGASAQLLAPSDMLNRDMAQRFGLALPWPLLPSGQPGMNSDM
ncbi:RIC1 domain-containing protein, partial [Haematococcus lacustris]